MYFQAQKDLYGQAGGEMSGAGDCRFVLLLFPRPVYSPGARRISGEGNASAFALGGMADGYDRPAGAGQAQSGAGFQEAVRSVF